MICKWKIFVVSRALRDMFSNLQNSAGVVTDYRGITSHVAIIFKRDVYSLYYRYRKCNQILEKGMLVIVDGNIVIFME